MSKYSFLLNNSHRPNVKVCPRTLCKIQIYMVINGKTVIPKVLHNIVNLIGIMLGKIIHNSLNGLRILNLPSQTNKIINGRTSRTNGNHLREIGSLQINGEDLNSGLTKIPVIQNYRPTTCTNTTTYES